MLQTFCEDVGVEYSPATTSTALECYYRCFASFYNAMLPQMRHLLAMLDTYPLGHLPDELHPLYWLSLSFAEVAPHIELYKGQVGVPFAFEEKGLFMKKLNLSIAESV